jgi:c-di-GMP-binding flagellar brake protein YcgR
MWQGVNRRRFPRAEYPCKIIITKGRSEEKLATKTENIGVGGVCVVLGRELPRFEEVGIILYLDDAEKPVHCRGRVVWVVRKSEIGFDTGVEFADLSDRNRLRIERLIEICQKGQNSSL